MQLFAKVLENIHGAVTRASVVEALNGLSSYSTGGLTPNVSFTKPSTVPGYSRILNPTVYGLTFENGQMKDIQPLTYINMFTGVSTPRAAPRPMTRSQRGAPQITCGAPRRPSPVAQQASSTPAAGRLAGCK